MELTVEEFAKTSAQFLVSQGECRPVAIDLAHQRLVVGDPLSSVSFISLGHALKESLDVSALERERVMHRRFWSSIQKPPESSLESIFKSVLPRVRDRAWFAAVRRQLELEVGTDEADDGLLDEFILPHEVVNAELSVHLAFELPTSVSEIGSDRIDAWDTSFASLYEHAKSNLRARSHNIFEEAAPGVFVCAAHDGFDASRLLLPELFSSLPLKGLPVAIAPTHDLLFVTGDQDEQGLTQIAEWSEESLSEPRSHSAVAFRLDKQVWKAWLPAAPHAARPKLKLLAIQTLASAYARQKDLLDALFESNGLNVMVPTMRAFRMQGGEVHTACAWTDGVEALLPKTDRVDFVRTGTDGTAATGKVWSTSFELAQKTVGALMVPTGDLPERYRVKSFPSLAQLESMAESGSV
jgi:hypothetical protein